jgi:hypothetical protein
MSTVRQGFFVKNADFLEKYGVGWDSKPFFWEKSPLIETNYG